MLGPFGDIVTYPTGAEAYLSWYPTCMRGWCTDLSPPPSWDAACNGGLDLADREAIAQSTLESFDRLVPGVASSAVNAVDAGVIFAWGDCDIDRPESELHQRHDTGIRPADGYFSINTGKLTCAPLFAHELSELV